MDIVERLRDPLFRSEALCLEAADEIERLREELHYCNGTCDLAMKHRDIAEAEIGRLRRELSYHAHTDEDIKVQNDEIERLRTALEMIVATKDSPFSSATQTDIARAVARRALTGRETGPT